MQRIGEQEEKQNEKQGGMRGKFYGTKKKEKE